MKKSNIGGLLCVIPAILLLAGCSFNFKASTTPTNQTTAPTSTTSTSNSKVSLQINPATQQSASTQQDATSQQTSSLNDSLLAMTLLNLSDVKGIDLFAHARPLATELNSHLDAVSQSYDYYVYKAWDDRSSQGALMDNTLTKYPSADNAQSDMKDFAKGFDQVKVSGQVGDAQAVFFKPAKEGVFPLVTYRFTSGDIGCKITLYFQSDSVKSSDKIVSDYAQKAGDIAKIQLAKIQDLRAGKITVTTNSAMTSLPTTIPGTKIIGSIPVTDQEWLGTVGDEEMDSIDGFQSAGLVRFSILSRPTEVVEVTALQFSTAQKAQEYQKLFLPTDQQNTDLMITLPSELTAVKAQAQTVKEANLVELQDVKNNILYDVTIVSPFDTLDFTAAKQDLVTMSKLVLGIK